MPFIDGRTIPEVLMRPGIHGRFLAHKDLGASRVSLLMNRAEPGAAVPLHMHEVEETVVMFEGRIWVQLGEERRVIGSTTRSSFHRSRRTPGALRERKRPG